MQQANSPGFKLWRCHGHVRSRTRIRPQLMITYSVRPGSESKGYEEWMQRADNPFSNAVPGNAHYSNWKVTGGAKHFAPHIHLDFMGIEHRDSFDEVWNGVEMNAFRHTCLCEH